MALTKVVYTDNVTVIGASNLNAIQDEIIANAAAIADKYEKPSGGIPKTDLATAVQASLGNADTAYQKPSGGVPETDLSIAVQAKLNSIGSNPELYEVEVHFNPGAFDATGSFTARFPNCVATSSIIRDIEIIEVAGSYQAGILFYNDNTYLGKLRPDMTIDKASGNWATLGGTVNIRELLEKFSANGIQIMIGIESTPSYETCYNTSYCKFYSFIEQKKLDEEHLQLANGTYGNTNSPNFYMDFNGTRVRTYSLIKVEAGDVIETRNDGGKYNSYYTFWKGLPGTSGATAQRTDVTTEDGEKIRYAVSGYVIFVFSLSGSTTTPISLDTFTGDLIIYRHMNRSRVIDDNAEGLKYAIGSQKNFTTASWSQNVPANNLASFVHISDVHGDKAQFECAYEVAKHINADALIDTGDTVYFYSTDDISFVANCVADRKTDFLMCIGNHDGFLLTDEQQYNKFILPFANTYGYQLDGNVSYPTYYFKDYANRKIRVLVVNQFEYDGQIDIAKDTRMCYTQAQVNFIVSALASTPQDYGVVLVMHTPEKAPVGDVNYKKFYQSNRMGSSNFMTILAEITDAFISGTTLNKSFNNPSGATPASVTVNADFTELNSGVEFICSLNGHYHCDLVSYVPNTVNKQLLLNVTTANSWNGMSRYGTSGSDNPYLTEGNDLQRIVGTPTEYAMNVYTIDRVNKNVRIVRIGANMPYDMSEVRDYMVIPYV